MLKQEPQTNNETASQTRVTPEELAAAITRLEARKDAGQRNLEGTVAIGEVVQQLGLDATPEELLAEVRAGRKQAGPQKRPVSLGYRLVLALGLCGIGLPIALIGIEGYNNINSNTPNQHIRIDRSSLRVKDASGRQVYLSEVSNDKIFYCRLGGQVLTASNYEFNDLKPAWTFIKHDGNLYVRGWMPRLSSKVLETEGTFINNSQSQQAPVAVTLPVSGFKVPETISGAEDESGTLYAADVHLDKHAYEKWQP